MHFSERFQAPAPLAVAWDFIWDAQRLAACLPGCVRVEEIQAGELYRARIEDHIGPYKVGFDLDIKVIESQRLERVRIQASGRDPRLGVTQKIDLTVALSDAVANGTSLAVEADVEVLGKIGLL